MTREQKGKKGKQKYSDLRLFKPFEPEHLLRED